jgi:hypothetical protein
MAQLSALDDDGTERLFNLAGTSLAKADAAADELRRLVTNYPETSAKRSHWRVPRPTAYISDYSQVIYGIMEWFRRAHIGTRLASSCAARRSREAFGMPGTAVIVNTAAAVLVCFCYCALNPNTAETVVGTIEEGAKSAYSWITGSMEDPLDEKGAQQRLTWTWTWRLTVQDAPNASGSDVFSVRLRTVKPALLGHVEAINSYIVTSDIFDSTSLTLLRRIDQSMDQTRKILAELDQLINVAHQDEHRYRKRLQFFSENTRLWSTSDAIVVARWNQAIAELSMATSDIQRARSAFALLSQTLQTHEDSINKLPLDPLEVDLHNVTRDLVWQIQEAKLETLITKITVPRVALAEEPSFSH